MPLIGGTSDLVAATVPLVRKMVAATAKSAAAALNISADVSWTRIRW